MNKKGSQTINWTQFWIYVILAIIGLLLVFTITESQIANKEQQIQVMRSEYLGLEGLNQLLRTPMEHDKDLADLLVEYYTYALTEETTAQEEQRQAQLRQLIKEQTATFIDAYVGEKDFVLYGIEYRLYKDGEWEGRSTTITVAVDATQARYNQNLLSYLKTSGRTPIEIVIPFYEPSSTLNTYYIKAVMMP